MNNEWNINAAFPEEHMAITPSNTVNLKRLMIIVVTEAGHISIVDKFDAAIIYTVVPGQTLPIKAKRVNATGTDITGIVGVF